MRSHDNCSCGFLNGIVVGGTLGAALVLLFLPKSGKEMRREIVQHARAWSNQAWKWSTSFRRNALPPESVSQELSPAAAPSAAAAEEKTAAKKVRTRKRNETPKKPPGRALEEPPNEPRERPPLPRSERRKK